MKVILKEEVASLGKRGDTVRVSDGYARNYLIPKGLALEATTKNAKELEHQKKMIAQQAEKERKQAEGMLQQFADVTVAISRKVGEQDKLFGSVTAKDIEAALQEKGFGIDRKQVVIEEPLKSLGEHPVKIKLYPGVFADIKVSIVREE